MIWKNITGYECLYQVSDSGLVKVLPRRRNSRHGEILYPGRLLKPAISKNGYLKVNLTINNIGKVYYIHKLVAIHFIDGETIGLEINHKDGNKLNNNSCNLEWVTHKSNQSHASLMGLMLSGERHPRYNPLLPHNQQKQ